MAIDTQSPVIPVGLIGTREIMAKDAKMPALRGDVTVRFGTPHRFDDDAQGDPLALRTFVDGLMYDICSLSGQEYKDEYADKRSKSRESVTSAA
jgi:1-acyl-sn-glycerol-3-phosphate acyltransferase